MKIVLNFFFISLLSACTNDNSDHFNEKPQSFDKEKYFSQFYKFRDSITKRVLLDSDFNSAAEDLTFIGQYSLSLAYYDKSASISPGVSKMDSLYFKGFIANDAFESISSIATDKRLICINEAHHQPTHRVFVEKLLPVLYAKGFRYFAVEALSNNPDDPSLQSLHQYGYPFMSSGYYICEPRFGNLLRTAIKLGFQVISYETMFQSDSFPGHREVVQARNINKIFQKDAAAKVLILCGYDHIYELEVPEWGFAMAGHLKRMSGIDPFTIDQVNFTERSSTEFDNPFYKFYNAKKPSIFIDEKKMFFNGGMGSDQYDVSVFHPRTRYNQGRPDWIFNSKRKPVVVTKFLKECSFPCLVMAYDSAEYFISSKLSEKPVPIDVIEITNTNDQTPMALGMNAYILEIHDKEGSRTQRINCRNVKINE